MTDETTDDDPTTRRKRTRRTTIERMVETIRPDWRVRDARPAEDGMHLVYHLGVETPDGTRECVLKATPAGGPVQNHTGARILGILDAHTSIPVPEVYGVVDDHPDLPAPFFLMASVDGRAIRRAEMDGVPAETFAWLARETGRHLAELHDLDATDRFGVVTANPARPLDGDPPAGSLDDVVVTGGTTDWREYVRSSAEDALEGLAETEFEDLVSPARERIDGMVDDLAGPFDPALGHVDNQPANLLFDEERRSVTGVLDWGFTLSVTPAYDLAFAEHSLAGGPWWFVPSTPDHSTRIREAMAEGYRAVGPERVVEQYRDHGDCYGLLAALHSANHFADRLADDGAGDAAIAGASERHREVIADRIATG